MRGFFFDLSSGLGYGAMFARNAGTGSFQEGVHVDQRLPIAAKRREIVEMVRANQVTIVAGETGSGKTTQVPQYLRADGLLPDGSMMGITQPRRVAAIGVGMFVAGQMGCELGAEIGYQIRHENITSGRTRIKFMTDGILLRELLADPLLKRYGVLVLDEVHERNLHQDVIMALVKDLLPWRPDLKVVLMSATIDEEAFARYFAAPIVRIEGRTHPVEIVYLGGSGDRVPQAVETVSLALRKTDGDVLVFVPDYRSIRRAVAGIEARCSGIDVLPLFGDQSPEDQKRIFSRTRRSVIVSTNIAETSITLDGVTAVVDTGLIKQMTYLRERSMSSLQVVPHSRAGCEQRTGRAGRTRPGICYRLFDAGDLRHRPAFTAPEILRSSLDEILLQLKGMGFTDEDVRTLDFMDRPPEDAWDEAMDRLLMLGAVADDGALTDDGKLMVDFPLPPMVSRMILSARRHGCVGTVTTIAATFAARPVFVFPKDEEENAREAHGKFLDRRSDYLSVLHAIRAWRLAADRESFARTNYLHHDALLEIDATESQIRGLLTERDIDTYDGRGAHAVAMAVASGLAPNLLVRQKDGTYRGRRTAGVRVSPGSAVFGKERHRFLVAAEIIETSRTYAHGVQVVSERWLPEIISMRGKDDPLARLIGAGRRRDRNGRKQKQRYRNRSRKR